MNSSVLYVKRAIDQSDSDFRRRQIQIDQSDCVNPKCVFPRRSPPKMASSMGGVASFRAEKLSLSLRARRDDFKLAVSDASSMKGVSTMQKETKMKAFFASPGESESRRRGRFDGQHGLGL